MSNDVTNSELARRLDSIQSSVSSYVLREVADANAKLHETRIANLERDLAELENDIKDAAQRRIDDRRQYIKLFVGALLASIVPTIALIVSLARGVPQ